MSTTPLHYEDAQEMTEYVPLDMGETAKKIAVLLCAPGDDPFLEELVLFPAKSAVKSFVGFVIFVVWIKFTVSYKSYEILPQSPQNTMILF